MEITAADVEKLVMDQGLPETLIVPNDDFAAIFAAYRNVSRDADGAFIMVMNTKVRPATQPEGGKTVDLGKSESSVFAEATTNGAKK